MTNTKEYFEDLLEKAIPGPVADTVDFRALRDFLRASIKFQFEDDILESVQTHLQNVNYYSNRSSAFDSALSCEDFSSDGEHTFGNVEGTIKKTVIIQEIDLSVNTETIVANQDVNGSNGEIEPFESNIQQETGEKDDKNQNEHQLQDTSSKISKILVESLIGSAIQMAELLTPEKYPSSEILTEIHEFESERKSTEESISESLIDTSKSSSNLSVSDEAISTAQTGDESEMISEDIEISKMKGSDTSIDYPLEDSTEMSEVDAMKIMLDIEKIDEQKLSTQNEVSSILSDVIIEDISTGNIAIGRSNSKFRSNIRKII